MKRLSRVYLVDGLRSNNRPAGWATQALKPLRYAAAVIIAAGVLGSAGSAQAQFEVIKPEIHGGGVELEYHGAYLTGHPDEEEEFKRHGHEFKVKLGITDFWELGAGFEAEQERGEDGNNNAFKATEVEIVSKFGLVPLHGDGIGLSFWLVYGTKVVGGANEEELKFGPIVKVQSGPWSATANLFPVHAFDVFEDGETEPDHWNFDAALQVKYQATERWAFGVEGYAEIVDFGNDLPGSEPEEYRLGPVVYLTLGKEHGHAMSVKDGHGDEHNGEHHGPVVKMAFGVLFGLNDDTNDTSLKWDVEFEF